MTFWLPIQLPDYETRSPAVVNPRSCSRIGASLFSSIVAKLCQRSFYVWDKFGNRIGGEVYARAMSCSAFRCFYVSQFLNKKIVASIFLLLFLMLHVLEAIPNSFRIG